MTNKYKNILKLAVGFAFMAGISACSEEPLNSESVFDTTVTELDPNSYTYKFDKWIKQEYTDRYNLTFIYRMEDLATDMNYNLVPAELNKAKQLAVLTKYLWFDVYTELLGSDRFLRQYGPKIIHLIGSTAINPANGTEILGLAEGGVKVSLFRVNSFDPTDFEQLNEKYFKTMHHEFAHILHQTKTYPREFDLISAARYEPMGWQERNGAVCASFGCTTPYASGQAREDFAETVANYITRTDAQWDLTLWIAERGWEEVEPPSGPGSKGVAATKYFYASDKDRTDDTKTYCCIFQEVDGVYTVTDALARLNAAGEMTGTNPAKRYFKSVPEINDYLAELKAKYDLYDVKDEDGVNGRDAILQKTGIARQWLTTAWGVSLDDLRHSVQVRQSSFDLPKLLSEIDNIK